MPAATGILNIPADLNQKMMKILYIVPYAPTEVRVRPFSLIRALAARGHQVTVATVFENSAERAALHALEMDNVALVALPLSRRRILRNVVRAVPSGDPLQSHYSFQPALLRALATSGSRWDVVHVEHLRGAHYALRLAQSPGAAPVVWDAVDCISMLFERTLDHTQSRVGRWRSRLDLARTRHFEARMLTEVNATVVSSAEDSVAMARLAPGSRPPIVVRNGVDSRRFYPDPAERRSPNTLVVSGKMSYHANLSMALYLIDEIMPLIWRQRPDARLTVVGKDPPALLEQRAEHPNITLTGTVPDIRPYLATAAVAVAPLVYGAGIQNKVLEAMACATPVVATPQAAGALDAVAGRDLLVAAEPSTFARHVLDLLAAVDLRQAIGAAGAAYVAEHHSWDASAQQLEQVYHEIIHHGHRVQHASA